MVYLLILLIGGLLSFFGPWWVLAPVCFALCWWKSRKASGAFWTSALAGMTLWLGYSIYLHAVSGVDLTAKVAGIFTAGIPTLAHIPATVLMLVIAALVIAPVSGLSGLAGLRARQFIRPPRG